MPLHNFFPPGSPEHGRVPHTLTAISDDQFHLKASFPEKGIEWDLNVCSVPLPSIRTSASDLCVLLCVCTQIYRVHGFYGSEDAEAGNIDGVCTMLSTLFSHDSEVEGTITERGRTYVIKREPRCVRACACACVRMQASFRGRMAHASRVAASVPTLLAAGVATCPRRAKTTIQSTSRGRGSGWWCLV